MHIDDSRIIHLVTDPFGQGYSPYVGMGNNPVLAVDPSGGEYHYVWTKTDEWWREVPGGEDYPTGTYVWGWDLAWFDDNTNVTPGGGGGSSGSGGSGGAMASYSYSKYNQSGNTGGSTHMHHYTSPPIGGGHTYGYNGPRPKTAEEPEVEMVGTDGIVDELMTQDPENIWPTEEEFHDRFGQDFLEKVLDKINHPQFNNIFNLTNDEISQKNLSEILMEFGGVLEDSKNEYPFTLNPIGVAISRSKRMNNWEKSEITLYPGNANELSNPNKPRIYNPGIPDIIHFQPKGSNVYFHIVILYQPFYFY